MSKADNVLNKLAVFHTDQAGGGWIGGALGGLGGYKGTQYVIDRATLKALDRLADSISISDLTNSTSKALKSLSAAGVIGAARVPLIMLGTAAGIYGGSKAGVALGQQLDKLLGTGKYRRKK